ncbi:hypothetical protein BGX20_010475 [Mortierella sp. AD010]|nr:hypothetical protein BGX20_010475 [Mortierella sp. AD010]
MCCRHLYDILIYSKERLAHARKVQTILCKDGAYAKLSKRHIISKDRVHANVALIKAIREWLRPTNTLTILLVEGVVDPDRTNSVELDVSGFGLGAVPFQTDANSESRPVTFASRKIGPDRVQ